MAVDKLHVPLNTVSANDEEGDRHITIDINDLNKADDTINERYDRSILNEIDPDINFLLSGLKSPYYSQKTFLDKYKNNTNFSILTSNVRSIPKNFKDLSIFLDSLKHDFSIIGITESWLKPSNVNDYTPDNYNHEYEIRETSLGGGVSLFISDKLKYIVRNDLQFDKKTGFNSVAIELDVHSVKSRKPIVVLLVYRPPKTSICDFTVGLNVILDILSKENKHIFIIGDFNIDVSKPYRCGKATQDFTNLLLSNSHFPLIHKPTRIVKSSASLIDNMYTNYTYDSCNCGILCSDVSDHFPVFCIIDCLSMTDKQSNTVTKRNFNCKNIAKFSRKLSSQNWNNVYNVDDAQIAFSVLQRVIDQLIEEIFPEQTIPVTYKTRLPWLNSELKAAIKARNSLSNLCKQNPTDKELHKSYKLNRNQVTAQIRNAHITYQSNELDIVKNDISKSWNVLKAIIGLQSSKKTQNMSYIVNNKHITDSYDISNAFNNFLLQ